MTVTEFPQDKIKALHSHLRLRGGSMTTAAINLAVLGRDPSPHLDEELNKVLLAASDRLDIEPVQVPGDGLYWRRREKSEPEPQPAPASTQPVAKSKKSAARAKPADKRDWRLDAVLMTTARQIARQMGAEGVPPGRQVLPSNRLVTLLSEQLGESITPNAFARSSIDMGGKWRDILEQDYNEGRKDYLSKVAEFRESKEAGEDADAAPSILAPAGPLPEPEQPEPALTPAQLVEAITELQEIVCASTNGNGSHPPDEPTDHDLSLVEEVAYLESELEESRREVESLQKRLEAAFAAVNVQTPQPAPQGTLQGVLDALEGQLARAKDEQTEAQWRLNEAAETVADLSEKLVAARQLVQVLEG